MKWNIIADLSRYIERCTIAVSREVSAMNNEQLSAARRMYQSITEKCANLRLHGKILAPAIGLGNNPRDDEDYPFCITSRFFLFNTPVMTSYKLQMVESILSCLEVPANPTYTLWGLQYNPYHKELRCRNYTSVEDATPITRTRYYNTQHKVQALCDSIYICNVLDLETLLNELLARQRVFFGGSREQDDMLRLCGSQFDAMSKVITTLTDIQ